MNTNGIATALLALVIVVFLFARQLIQRPVTQRSLLMPLILNVALGGLFLLSHPTLEGTALVIIGEVLGVGTGLFSGQLIRVWRDEATGTIFQRGGWRYLIVLIVLLLMRVLIRYLFMSTGNSVAETTLNAAFIAAIVGNFLGRNILTTVRALPLVDGSEASLSSR
jgi:membrane protein CcdC involved in cytochrome C biogenesis